jgi:hypothetical protein
MWFSRVVWGSFAPFCALVVACGSTTDFDHGSGGGGHGGASGAGGHTPVVSAGMGGAAAGVSGATAGNGGSSLGGGGASGSAGHGAVSGSGGVACTPVAHEAPVIGTLSKDFSAVSAAALGIYQVSSYFEQADSCSAMCAATPVWPYLLVRPEDTYVRACACQSVANCQMQAQQAFCNSSYQIDFTMAASDTVLSGLSGYVETVNEKQMCSGAWYKDELIQLTPDTIRIDGSGVYSEFPPTIDPQNGLDDCEQSKVEANAANAPCNRLQVLEAKRIAPLP